MFEEIRNKISESTNTRGSLDGFWGTLRAIGSYFVTPLSLIAVMFILSVKFAEHLFDTLVDKGEKFENLIRIGIYGTLGFAVLCGIIVLVLTIWKPENLIYDTKANLANKGIALYGSDSNPQRTLTTATTLPPSSNE